MREKDRQIAAESLLLEKLPGDLKDTLIANAHALEFDRGATIFLQGERARAIYIVAEGWVKLYRISPSGSEAIVGVFTRGRSFGEAVAFHDNVYPVSAEAATYCRVIRIDASIFIRMIRENHEMALAILSATFTHLHSLVAQVEALKARTGAQRVAEFLLELCDCDHDDCDGSCTVRLPYDKVLIAGRLGMKPESLSRAFGKLKTLGVNVTRETAEINDLAVLRDYAEDDPANAWSKP
ncbi:Crp/Fnr family transcriptional regulator [Rhodobacteraceae bacterium 10Alg 79]|uniref:Crp/Fnr family transcriptional regulator n=2 Tax=Rhodalgimonas zhirmunskyi TaxID=2964767 RepID=A0AAJ1UCR5_9RHOB|nr:Crp/Fnr family transcriptional regulator [Rhodoalgimonas zhirmunskyi]